MTTSHTLRDRDRAILKHALNEYMGMFWPKDKDTYTEIMKLYQITTNATVISLITLEPHDRSIGSTPSTTD